jgi:CheY-like chemotaxis protein
LRGANHDRQLDAIDRSVAAGKKLTRQLLAFSRRQPLLPRVLDLRTLMPALVELIQPALGGRIGLTADVAPDTRPVLLDSAELELALINLAVNARDAMPEGGKVHIRVHEVDGFVELAFSDTGMGIDAKDLERVFEPFFTTKPLGSGTGLGLSQVYGLCARAGGAARVESTHGAGTTVLLRFPAVDAQPDLPAPDERASRPMEQLGLRVLLVEDNADIASATREVLQAAGCDVVHVPQPALVPAALSGERRIDIVLSDIVMPGGIDGLQLSEQLRHSHPQLPVVLMTGYAEKLGEAEAQGLVVLPKPFDPALLLRTLREQLQVGERGGIVRVAD